jgi:hypothetical protein
MTSGMIVPPNSLILFSCISVMAHTLMMLAYSNHETTSYLIIMLPALNSVLLDTCLRARRHEYEVKWVNCWLKTPLTGAFFIRTNSSDKNTQTKSKRFFSNMLTAIPMKPRPHNYLKQLCMPLKAPSLKPKTARRTGSTPVNPTTDPPPRDTAQRAYKNFLADGSNANQQHWQASRRHYHQVQHQAKKQYFNQVAVKASEIAMCGRPKEAWEAVWLLEKGSTAHH